MTDTQIIKLLTLLAKLQMRKFGYSSICSIEIEELRKRGKK